MGRSRGVLGRVLGGLGGVLKQSRGVLRRSWDGLGVMLGLLGRILKRPGAILGRIGAVLGPFLLPLVERRKASIISRFLLMFEVSGSAWWEVWEFLVGSCVFLERSCG